MAEVNSKHENDSNPVRADLIAEVDRIYAKFQLFESHSFFSSRDVALGEKAIQLAKNLYNEQSVKTLLNIKNIDYRKLKLAQIAFYYYKLEKNNYMLEFLEALQDEEFKIKLKFFIADICLQSGKLESCMKISQLINDLEFKIELLLRVLKVYIREGLNSKAIEIFLEIKKNISKIKDKYYKIHFLFNIFEISIEMSQFDESFKIIKEILSEVEDDEKSGEKDLVKYVFYNYYHILIKNNFSLEKRFKELFHKFERLFKLYLQNFINNKQKEISIKEWKEIVFSSELSSKLEDKLYSEALDYIKGNPGAQKNLTKLIEACLESKDYDFALEVINLLKDKNQKEGFLFDLAEIFINMKEYKKALKMLMKIKEISLKDVLTIELAYEMPFN